MRYTLMRGGVVCSLVGLITRRSSVQIRSPLPNIARSRFLREPAFSLGRPPCRSPPFSPLPLESRTRHPHLVDKSTRSLETRPCLSSIRAPANPSPPTPPPATPARPPPAPTRCPR